MRSQGPTYQKRSELGLGLRSHGVFRRDQAEVVEGEVVARDHGRRLGHYVALDDERHELLKAFIGLATHAKDDADCVEFAERFGLPVLKYTDGEDVAAWRKEAATVVKLLRDSQLASGAAGRPARALREKLAREMTSRLGNAALGGTLAIRAFVEPSTGRIEADLLTSRLIDAINVQLLQEVVTKNKPLGSCDACGRPFVRERRWQRFCTPRCRARVWARRSGKRRRR